MRRMRAISHLVVPSMVVMTMACRPDIASPLRDEAGSVSQLAPHLLPHLAAARAYPRGVEDVFLDVDSRTGAFGGWYLDESDDRLVVLTTDPSRSSAIAEEVRGEMSRVTDPSWAIPRLEFKIARYRFSELVAFQEIAAKALLGLGLVHMSDADEKLNRVRLGIADTTRNEEVRNLLERAGAPADAFLLHQAGPSAEASTLQQKQRPTGGGLQIQIDRPFLGTQVCSIGYNVTLNSTGYRYLLTNSHCTAEYYGGVGYQVYQHAVGGSNLVGQVEVNPTWASPPSASCDTMALCRYSDAALVRYSLAPSSTPSRIFRPCFSSTNPSAPGTILINSWCGGGHWDVVNSSGYFPFVGQGLEKVGRTSGWTIGLVTATCEHLTTYSIHGGTLYLKKTLCSDRVGAYADGADSGSPVFFHSGPIVPSARIPMGILFAYRVDSAAPGYPRSYSFSRRQMIELDLGTLTF